ncbi:hypothetical protein [Enterovibrio calviensis]|uniref:hypothetical protein n=1 Tax=Enterovibrio calviensis TaxID=91359 RepID=UPI000488C151|nr:hypothetical protein [Enterovibrio calviensis]
MASKRTLKHVTGLKEVEAMLDSLTDSKFRKAALRAAGRKALDPVKTTLQSKIPVGDSEQDSYKHYQGSSKKEGYTSGDLRNGVKIKIAVNTDKKIRTNSSGFAKGNMTSELFATVTFDNHVYKLASILENGRQKRVAKTRNGKVFHYFGSPTDMVQRDIGTFKGKHFVSSTFAEHESSMVERFRVELIGSIDKQVKKMEKANARK